VHGQLRPEATAAVRRIVERLAADSCDAVVLGCTELPLILDDAHSPLLALDSTRLLARAALHAAA
jgi:aspartate racemase